MDTCPVCAGPAVQWCKCLLGNRSCAEGHAWKPCPVHRDAKVVIPDAGGHGDESDACQCGEASPAPTVIDIADDDDAPPRRRRQLPDVRALKRHLRALTAALTALTATLDSDGSDSEEQDADAPPRKKARLDAESASQ